MGLVSLSIGESFRPHPLLDPPLEGEEEFGHRRSTRRALSYKERAGGEDGVRRPSTCALPRPVDHRTFVRYLAGMEKDARHLATLQDYYAKHRVLPSYASIGELVGLSSKASVAELVVRLKAAGFVESTPDRRLKPGRRFFERPVGASVRAGLPNPAADTGPDSLAIDEYLVPNPSRTLLIPVKGDSMIDAGIHPGDIVIVEKRSSANVGDIVVAIVDNEFTLKRLAREKGRAVLKPENKAYPVIRPEGELEIFGVVVGQFRKY